MNFSVEMRRTKTPTHVKLYETVKNDELLSENEAWPALEKILPSFPGKHVNDCRSEENVHVGNLESRAVGIGSRLRTSEVLRDPSDIIFVELSNS